MQPIYESMIVLSPHGTHALATLLTEMQTVYTGNLE